MNYMWTKCFLFITKWCNNEITVYISWWITKAIYNIKYLIKSLPWDLESGDCNHLSVLQLSAISGIDCKLYILYFITCGTQQLIHTPIFKGSSVTLRLLMIDKCGQTKENQATQSIGPTKILKWTWATVPLVTNEEQLLLIYFYFQFIYTVLETIIFHYVYCMHQISDTMCTGNLDVYRLSYSHEIYLLQSKTNYMHMFILYICFQTCSCRAFGCVQTFLFSWNLSPLIKD